MEIFERELRKELELDVKIDLERQDVDNVGYTQERIDTIMEARLRVLARHFYRSAPKSWEKGQNKEVMEEDREVRVVDLIKRADGVLKNFEVVKQEESVLLGLQGLNMAGLLKKAIREICRKVQENMTKGSGDHTSREWKVIECEESQLLEELKAIRRAVE